MGEASIAEIKATVVAAVPHGFRDVIGCKAAVTVNVDNAVWSSLAIHADRRAAKSHPTIAR